jgi:hypothetical protein
MEKVIIFNNAAGAVTLCVPTGELPIEVVQQKDVPFGTSSFIVNRNDIPQEMDFFSAWEQNQGVVSINFTKAQQVTKERLREERIPLFAALDIQFQQAIEAGESTTAIIAEKQRLRDITTLTDACTTLDELRALKVAK